MAVDYEGFSIREYTRNIRSVEVRQCWPFSGDATGDLIHSLLPPITVAKFRWWSHELASLLTKSPDDSDPAFGRKAKAKSKPCKKRSIAEIARGEDARDDDSEVLIGSKRKKTKERHVVVEKKLNDSLGAKTANKVNGKGIKERSGVMMSPSRKKAGVRCCLSYTEEEIFPDSPKSFSQDWDSKFQIPGILKAKRKACSVKSPDKLAQSDKHVRFSDNDGILSQLWKDIFSLEQCCLNMSRLSLFPAEVQSSVADKKMVVVSNGNMQFQSVVSESRLSHARGESGLSCFPEPHLSQESVKRNVAQPIQSFISDSSESTYRSCSYSAQPASADMNCGTLLYQSPVGELVDANGEGCKSFDWSSLGTGTSISESAENDLLLKNLVYFSSGKKKHSTDPAIPKDGVGKIPVHNERRHKYFPARLGIDETFTEDVECGQTVHSSVPEVNPMESAAKHLNLNQNLNIRDTQATMRLLGKDVSVGTSYSDLARAGERIIAPDASVDCPFLGSHARQSWLWPRTTVGISENHSTTSLDKSWSRNLLCSNDPYPLLCEPNVCLAPEAKTAVVPDSEFQCGSLVSCPLTDKDLSFHGYGLGQQLNSFTFSQSNPEIAGLHSDYNNVGTGLLPNARKPSFGLPFSCTESTRQPQPHYWPQSSFESSNLGMSYIINPAEQLVSFYESKSSSSSYINVGKANKRLPSVEEYPMKNQKIPKLAMPGGLNSEKEFFAGSKLGNHKSISLNR